MSKMPERWERKPWWAKTLIIVFHPLLIVVYLLTALGWAVGVFE